MHCGILFFWEGSHFDDFSSWSYYQVTWMILASKILWSGWNKYFLDLSKTEDFRLKKTWTGLCWKICFFWTKSVLYKQDLIHPNLLEGLKCGWLTPTGRQSHDATKMSWFDAPVTPTGRLFLGDTGSWESENLSPRRCSVVRGFPSEGCWHQSLLKNRL